MIPIGQPYRPVGTLDARSILITSILGISAAVIGAALVWLWEWSPIPTLVIITPLLQGVAVGRVMSFAIGRLRMRNPWIVTVVGFACGLLSIVLVHYGHYLHMMSTAPTELRTEIAEDESIGEEKRQTLLAELDADPGRFANAMLLQQTNHSGFVGSLFLRNAQGVIIKGSVVTGPVLWILWGGEALLVAACAAAIPRQRAAAPFCEECGCWCARQPDLFTLPAAGAEPLIQAVEENNPKRLAALRANPPVDDGSGLVTITLHSCPGCDQSFADVSRVIVKKKKKQVKILLKHHRVAPEVVDVIRPARSPTATETPIK